MAAAAQQRHGGKQELNGQAGMADHTQPEQRDNPSHGDPLALMYRYGPLGTYKGTRRYKSQRAEIRAAEFALMLCFFVVVLLVAGVVRLVQWLNGSRP
ncbi:hypothetical protein [Streptomyces sp. NPDC058739]|uniref:hypothetical protein n=1 Tax=Streptomyces sp. NPDC058739 TaxID=3346618 RepID=UPI0036A20318